MDFFSFFFKAVILANITQTEGNRLFGGDCF